MGSPLPVAPRSATQPRKAATPPGKAATPPRKAFALTGRSADLDPRCYAVRPDLADVRLATQIFAPHYAVAVDRQLATGAALRLARDGGSATIATLTAGEPFELLDVIGDTAWGIAPTHGLVGYLPVAALADAD